MRTHRFAPLLLILAVAVAAPATAQGVPDYIPDKPGESLADREKERLIERYRGTLGRFFTGGSFAVAPATGPAYQMNVGLGLMLGNGDALLFELGARTAPPVTDTRDAPAVDHGMNEGAWMAGLGYEFRGTRILGPTPLGWRTGLELGTGVMSGDDLTTAFFEVVPTYALIVRSSWSVPAGLRLSVVTMDSRDLDSRLTRAFLGFEVGVRWHLMRRDRLD